MRELGRGARGYVGQGGKVGCGGRSKERIKGCLSVENLFSRPEHPWEGEEVESGGERTSSIVRSLAWWCCSPSGNEQP